jgi:hypothetical protein
LLAFPASTAAHVPNGSTPVFRDAGPKSQAQVLATAALYARSAEAMSSTCAFVEQLVRALSHVNARGKVPDRLIKLAKYLIQHAEILGVDSACTMAKKLSWAAINLNTTARNMFPTCMPGPRNPLCSYKVYLETTIRKEDRLFRPDVCHWKLSSGSTVRYLAGSRGC